MTSIAVKLKLRIEQLENKNSPNRKDKVNYVEPYLNYLIVRTIFRGFFAMFGKVMRSQGEENHFKSLKAALFIFAGISFYFSMHALFCFDELKVGPADPARNLDQA